MKIEPVKTKKIKRSSLEDYESIKIKDLRQMMRENDGSESARTLNDLTPAINLLYFIHQRLMDENEEED
ncbi:hypothetical protein FYJ74_06385 [Pyramidobacter sp. SM-530-WT-4B]|uniref:Uncharacterized protein n=1 Tax=Pyramidobacter porci TaxID=2605789 RepID=A0A6L5YBP4_9BACT|nr:hypothetical protein [Pyramidobacter porci]MST55660.1 hypothetical protein [Pyramidobacter porci]